MFLTDTNVVSEPRQKRPDPRVLDWLTAHEAEIFISAVTIAELQSGIAMLAPGRRRTALQAWFDTLLHLSQGTVLAFDGPVAVRWGIMNADLIRQGKRLPISDSFLAAMALHHNLSVATRNEQDFLAAGVQTVNPWTAL
jgi:predicted nucleic acid-binding protein